MILASKQQRNFKFLLQHVSYIFGASKFLCSANNTVTGAFRVRIAASSLRITARRTAHIDNLTIGHLYNASSAFLRTRMLFTEFRRTCHNVSQTSTAFLVKSNGDSVCRWNVQSLRIKLKSNDMSNWKVAQIYIKFEGATVLVHINTNKGRKEFRGKWPNIYATTKDIFWFKNSKQFCGLISWNASRSRTIDTTQKKNFNFQPIARYRANNARIQLNFPRAYSRRFGDYRLVAEKSENLHILTRLSARGKFCWILSPRKLRHLKRPGCLSITH
jgi:hypothetical protein